MRSQGSQRSWQTGDSDRYKLPRPRKSSGDSGDKVPGAHQEHDALRGTEGPTGDRRHADTDDRNTRQRITTGCHQPEPGKVTQRPKELVQSTHTAIDHPSPGSGGHEGKEEPWPNSDAEDDSHLPFGAKPIRVPEPAQPEAQAQAQTQTQAQASADSPSREHKEEERDPWIVHWAEEVASFGDEAYCGGGCAADHEQQQQVPQVPQAPQPRASVPGRVRSVRRAPLPTDQVPPASVIGESGQEKACERCGRPRLCADKLATKPSDKRRLLGSTIRTTFGRIARRLRGSGGAQPGYSMDGVPHDIAPFLISALNSGNIAAAAGAPSSPSSPSSSSPATGLQPSRGIAQDAAGADRPAPEPVAEENMSAPHAGDEQDAPRDTPQDDDSDEMHDSDRAANRPSAAIAASLDRLRRAQRLLDQSNHAKRMRTSASAPGASQSLSPLKEEEGRRHRQDDA
jgi:hypothetical protein